MRRAASGTVVAGLLLLVPAAPAHAKGISYAHFSGPGLPARGLTLVRPGPRVQRTGLVALKKGSIRALGAARGELGTAYRARYRMDYAPRHTLRQVLYPYARGGPITYTPRGQHIGSDYESFRGGWHRAGPPLLHLLMAHGFPSRDPALASAMSEGPKSKSRAVTNSLSAPWKGWSPVFGGSLLFLLLAGALAKVLRSRGLRSKDGGLRSQGTIAPD